MASLSAHTALPEPGLPFTLAKRSLTASLLCLSLLWPAFAHARPQVKGGRRPPAPRRTARKKERPPRPPSKAGAPKAGRPGEGLPLPIEPNKLNENSAPGGPPGGPRIRLGEGRKGLDIPREPLEEYERQIALLRDSIKKGEALKDKPGNAEQREDAFYIWKAECDQILDNIFETLKRLQAQPPDYRATFDAITEPGGESLSEADPTRRMTKRLNRAIGYLGKIVVAPMGMVVNEP